jgi:hypothetical protein
MYGTPWVTAALRMGLESICDFCPPGTLMMRLMSPPLIRSMMSGFPSPILGTILVLIWFELNTRQVPSDAYSLNPMAAIALAMKMMLRRMELRTLMNTAPCRGRLLPAASCDFAKASPKSLSSPMTSPVDFISGPRMISAPGNLLNGNTDSLTAK